MCSNKRIVFEPRHVIRVRPARVANILCALVAALVVLDLIGFVFRFGLGHGRVLGFVPTFDLEQEANVPTYFSSFLLLAAAGLLAVIASWKNESGASFRRHWATLAIIFLCMSIDELAGLHEQLHTLLVEFDLRPGGWFHFAWVIPGLVFVALFGLTYFKFFLHLGRRFQRLFLGAGLTYVAGALGMEMISGRHVEVHGYDVAAALMSTVEETLELIGIALFIYALLTYIDAHIPVIRVQTRDAQEEEEVVEDVQVPA